MKTESLQFLNKGESNKNIKHLHKRYHMIHPIQREEELIMMTVCEGVFAIMLLRHYAITIIFIIDLVYVH